MRFNIVKGILISACIISLMIVSVFVVNTSLKKVTPKMVGYKSKEYQYVRIIDGDLLESAKKNTKPTGIFVDNREIYEYSSDSSLIYLKDTDGNYLLYHTGPMP